MDKKKDNGFLSINDKYKKIIVIAGFVGIVLIFFSGYFKSDDNKKDTDIKNEITTQEYTKQLENNLKSIVSSIDGAGETKIMITLENSHETKYATEEKTNSEALQETSKNSGTQSRQSGDSELKYIIVKDANGSEKALAITEFEPTVKGVVVVCSGGDIPAVEQRIISAVTTALNVSSKKVCVTKLSN